MIAQLEKKWRRLRRALSRSNWVVRLLGLRPSPDAPGLPGVVLLQIDGLSRKQFQRALANGKLPYLRYLLRNEGYCETTFYSGIPSTTPAVQGELHYGVPTAVPAFYWYDRKAGTDRRMFSPEDCQTMAGELSSQREPLLRGGSSYSNIYSGGARLARFCGETLDAGHILRMAAPWRLLLVGLSHLFVVLKLATLLTVELGLAIHDAIRGIVAQHNPFKEMKFILARVGITVLARELIRYSAKVDLARGQRIIHANFLGYDEHAHRRGPSSRFAHWSLKGIDDVVRDICQSADNSSQRDYHVIIFSDHGQESVRSYARETGQSLDHAVKNIFRSEDLIASASPHNESGTKEENTADRLYERALHHLRLTGKRVREKRFGGMVNEDLAVTAMGPMAHVYYLGDELTVNDKKRLAQRLVDEENIPAVYYKDEYDQVFGYMSGRMLRLPRDMERELGNDHPLARETARDMTELARSKKAGDLVCSGWTPEASWSFPEENGSHGGPGAEEVQGFALLPPEFPRKTRHPDWIRPLDLRGAVFDLFHTQAEHFEDDKDTEQFRLLTYNIHSCAGMDGQVRPERIARILRNLEADVIALQEVDRKTVRSRGLDQLEEIADELGFYRHYLPLVPHRQGDYGIGILSRYPVRILDQCTYRPSNPRKSPREERGYLHARIATPAGPLHLINTHLGLSGRERREQIRELQRAGLLDELPQNEAVVLAGDFNAGPHSDIYRHLIRHYQDAQRATPDPAPKATFFSRRPLRRIDHLFVSNRLEVRSSQVVHNRLTRVASDHLPLLVEACLVKPNSPSASLEELLVALS